MPRRKPSQTSGASAEVLAARAKLAARMGGSRTGGKGTVRRKKKAKSKNSGGDDKKLTQTLKRLGVNSIPAIEEVNMFKDDGSVIHFKNPKVQASIQSNTYVVSGKGETKQLQELLPGIITQLGADNLQNLKKIAEAYQQSDKKAEADEDDDDEDVPELVENFDDVAQES
jgi:nascent polypeptide-associated complex subunit beta